MQSKITLINDMQSKILSHTAISFYDKNNSFTDALMRQTLFLNNASISLRPKFVKRVVFY